jgi:hypothetical protein
MPKTSVVIVTYRRLDRIADVCAAWVAQSPDVWLCDCSPHGAKGIPSAVKIVQFVPDPGNKSRHAVALLTDGDFVIKADDDVLPAPGLIDDYHRSFQKVGPGIFGLNGRVFNGPSYYKNSKSFRAPEISIETLVDFAGVCTFTPREYLAFDLRGCDSPIEDLFWQIECFPEVIKWIIPTKKFTNLPSANDDKCLFRSADSRAVREKYFKRIYEDGKIEKCPKIR